MNRNFPPKYEVVADTTPTATDTPISFHIETDITAGTGSMIPPLVEKEKREARVRGPTTSSRLAALLPHQTGRSLTYTIVSRLPLTIKHVFSADKKEDPRRSLPSRLPSVSPVEQCRRELVWSSRECTSWRTIRNSVQHCSLLCRLVSHYNPCNTCGKKRVPEGDSLVRPQTSRCCPGSRTRSGRCLLR